jgi:hypothetical protein
VNRSNPANDNLIDRTREVWQRRLGPNLADEEACQISENVNGFFAILAEWSRVEIPTPANDINDFPDPGTSAHRPRSQPGSRWAKQRRRKQ